MTGRKSDVWEWALIIWPITILMAAGIGYGLLILVGETVEHFTP